MAKHIIIEGLDKTGKSTLAGILSKRLMMPIKKFSAPKEGENPLDDYTNFLVHEKVPHIIDRCYMSEIAYGPVKRGGSRISQSQKDGIEEICKMNGIVCIYADGNIEDIARRFDEDREDHTKKSEIEAIKANYDRETVSSSLNWYVYHIGEDMEKWAAWCAKQLS